MKTDTNIITNIDREYVDWDSIKKDYNVDDNSDFINPFSEISSESEHNYKDKNLSILNRNHNYQSDNDRDKSKLRKLQEKYVMPRNPYSYQEELRLIKNFKLLIETPPNDTPEELSNKFKDILDLPVLFKNIKSNTDLIPSEMISDEGSTIELNADNDGNNDIEAHKSEVAINKNHNDEIDSIQISCVCGEITIIKFTS